MVVKSRRADHAADTRRALVTSARRLFGQRGYTATSLDDICDRAGVTKGALYHHFRNKEDLFVEALEQVEEDLVRAGAADANDSPAASPRPAAFSRSKRWWRRSL